MKRVSPPPAVRIEGLFFRRLAESREFAEFARILKRLTGLSMALNTPDVDSSRRGVTGDLGNPICQIIRDTDEGFRRCKACDLRHHALAGRDGKPRLYTCYAGFIDMAIPILIQQEHVATLSSGQVLPEKPSKAGLARVLRRLRWLDVPKERLRAAYKRAPWLPRDRLTDVMNLLALFSGQMVDRAWRIREMEASRQRPEIRVAQALIEERFSDPNLTLDEVAAAAGLSRAHFSSVFHKQTGVTFVRYVQTRRMEESKRLLSQPDRSITDICYACGFNSLTHFNRVFRRGTGGSPSDYRKNPSQP